MTVSHTNTPWRAQLLRAKIWHIFKPAGVLLTHKIGRIWRDPRQGYPHLSDHQATDIGLDAADLEWSKVKFPSQTTHHPML